MNFTGISARHVPKKNVYGTGLALEFDVAFMHRDTRVQLTIYHVIGAAMHAMPLRCMTFSKLLTRSARVLTDVFIQFVLDT